MKVGRPEGSSHNVDVRIVRDDPNTTARFQDSIPIFKDLVSGAEYRALRFNERMSRASDEALSSGKFFRGALTGNWENAEAELRANSGNLGASGGFLLPTVISNLFVDAARNKTRVMQAGALAIELPARDVTIAKVTKDAEASYKAENAIGDESEMEFGTIAMKAFTLAVYATLSQEILQDAVNLDAIVTNAFAEAIAREMDRAALFGSGTNTPIGLYNADTNVISPNANGFTLSDYDEFSSAITAIENANGEAKAAILLAAHFSPTARAERGRDKSLPCATGVFHPACTIHDESDSERFALWKRDRCQRGVRG